MAHHHPRQVLDALRTDRSVAQWASAFKARSGDWDELVVHALVFGLAPLLHHRLSTDPDAASLVPPVALAKLGVNRKAHAARFETIRGQLAEVLRAAAPKGIEIIGLKGVFLAEHVYPEPGLRPMNDIDLLVRPKDLEAVEALLTSLGYEGKHKDPTLGPGVIKHTSTFKRPGATARTANPYLSTAGECMIEPHTSLEERWFGLSIDITPGLWDRSSASTLAGQPCRRLAPEDLLLHLIVHFSFNLIMGQPTMVQLVDLPTVIQREPIDWRSFQERAVRRGAGPHALAALSLARRLLGAEVPEEVMRALERSARPSLRDRIEGLDLEHVLRRTQQRPLNTLGDRLKRGLEDRAEAARWAPGLRGRLEVWKTAVAFRRTDTWRKLTTPKELRALLWSLADRTRPGAPGAKTKRPS